MVTAASYSPPVQSGVSAAQLAAPYLLYDLRVKYIYDSGNVQLPVAFATGAKSLSNEPPAATCKIVQVSKPIGKKIVRFNLIRQGAECVAPDPTSTNSNEVLDKMVVTPHAPVIMPDNVTYKYFLTGKYIYNLLTPYYVDDNLSAGSTQADVSTPAQNSLTQTNFVGGMI